MSGLKREPVVGPLGLDMTPTPIPTPDRSRELALLLGRSLHMLNGESTDRSLSCGSSLMWTWLEEASTGGDVCCWVSECSGDTSVPLMSVEPLSPIKEPSPSVSVVSSSFTLTSVRGKCWWQRMWSFRLKWREEVKGQSSHWNVSPRSWCWCTWEGRTGVSVKALPLPSTTGHQQESYIYRWNSSTNTQKCLHQEEGVLDVKLNHLCPLMLITIQKP